MGVQRYGLDLRRSIQETLSGVFYRMYYYDIIASCGVSIAGQITVQMDAERDARSFWWGGVGSGLTKPINLHCSVDVLKPLFV
jgi:hypothetical protein